jgi:hypothetical protein
VVSVATAANLVILSVVSVATAANLVILSVGA